MGKQLSELSGYAWESAINNTAEWFGIPKRFSFDNWMELEKIIDKIGIRFDLNGNIIDRRNEQ